MPHADLIETILASITRPGDGPDAADRLEPLTVATKWLPANRGGKPSHVSKVLRAGQRGTPKPDGRRAYWRQVRSASGWFTTRRWTAEYLAELTAAYSGGRAETNSPQPSAARRKAHERAERELARAGF